RKEALRCCPTSEIGAPARGGPSIANDERDSYKGLAAVLVLACSAAFAHAQPFHPEIPRVWDDQEMARFELPLANAAASPRHVPAEYYYRIPVRTIYKSYPPVAPGQDFDEYVSRLEQTEPEI